MRPQHSGSIILTASVAGLTAWSHAAPYCATKAAVIQTAKVAAVEYARDGIRVNCVCPGTFLSGIHDGLPQEAIDAIAAKHPLGLGDADDLVGAYSYLAGDAIPLDHRLRDRGRRRLRRAVAMGTGDDAPRHELVSACWSTTPTARPTSRSRCFGDQVVTYGGWRSGRRRSRADSHARGVGAGDVVALLSYNNVEFLGTIFAANHLGAIAMPINWRLAAPELRFILEHSGARALVCGAELVEPRRRRDRDLGGELGARLHRRRHVAGWERFADLRADGPPPARVPAAADDLHRLMYTSGTTGRPKGVMLTHANLAWKNFAHVTEFGFTADDVGLACGPLYHVGALDLVTTTMISVGATTIVHPTFDAAQVVDEIERSRVTTIWAAPAMVRAVLDVPGIETRDLSSVRVIIAGGEKMPIPLHRAHPHDLPVGVVRRRVRAHRDGLGRHLPRPRAAP